MIPGTLPTRLAHANKGRSLELAVLASQGNLLTLAQIPPGVRWVGPGKTVPVPSPVDFMGTVRGCGRSICFDAKRAATVRSFGVGHKDHVPEHQRRFIVRQGEAGAVAGLLVEATHLGEYRWLGWRHLLDGAASLKWADPAWVCLGPTTDAIRFDLIPGVRVSVPAEGGRP